MAQLLKVSTKLTGKMEGMTVISSSMTIMQIVRNYLSVTELFVSIVIQNRHLVIVRT